jgi:two-component system response regulator GlrR
MPPPVTERLSRGTLLRLEPRTGTLRSRSFRLAVLSGPDQGRSMVLEGTLLLGSHPEASFRLSDPSVSRYHLELQVHQEGVRIRDLNSTNGTFAGGAALHEVTAGNTRLRIFEQEEDLGPVGLTTTALGGTVGQSPSMRQLLGTLERVAATEATVLLEGETGTGKEVLARALHHHSERRHRPLVVLDCSALAPGVVESTLFGHARGAFSGAVGEQQGVFLEADGGTLFLDEVGELPLELQPRLLRALETRTITRVGETRARAVDVRFVAATHRNLEAEVAAGRFRQDLYFRLAVVQLRVPPLRERTEDIPLLVRHFVTQAGKADFPLSGELLQRLAEHTWPGNVRELRNTVERALAGQPLQVPVGLLPAAAVPAREELSARPFKEAKERLLEDFTREYLAEVLQRCGDNITAAARQAGLARPHFHELLRRYRLRAD